MMFVKHRLAFPAPLDDNSLIVGGETVFFTDQDLPGSVKGPEMRSDEDHFLSSVW